MSKRILGRRLVVGVDVGLAGLGVGLAGLGVACGDGVGRGVGRGVVGLGTFATAVHGRQKFPFCDALMLVLSRLGHWLFQNIQETSTVGGRYCRHWHKPSALLPKDELRNMALVL